MILSASMLGETAGAGTHQSKSKKGRADFPLYRNSLVVYNIVTLYAKGTCVMEKEVIISIKGMQDFEQTGKDSIELVTRGNLGRRSGVLTLSYEESELTGLEGTLTTIQVEPERVTMMRTGQVNTQMVFQEGRRHLSMYNTPYGAMAVGVNTRHLYAELDENGGDLEIEYAIEIDHAIVGRNIFQINVKQADSCPIKQ